MIAPALGQSTPSLYTLLLFRILNEGDHGLLLNIFPCWLDDVVRFDVQVLFYVVRWLDYASIQEHPCPYTTQDLGSVGGVWTEVRDVVQVWCGETVRWRRASS